MTATCRRCEAPIRWAKTEKGRPVPVDLEPAPNGNLRLQQHGRELLAVYVARPKLDEPPAPQRSLFEADDDEMPPAPAAQLDPAVFDSAAAALYGPLYLSHFVTCPHAHEFRKRTPAAGGTGQRVRSEGGAGPANARRARRRTLGHG